MKIAGSKAHSSEAFQRTGTKRSALHRSAPLQRSVSPTPDPPPPASAGPSALTAYQAPDCTTNRQSPTDASPSLHQEQLTEHNRLNQRSNPKSLPPRRLDNPRHFTPTQVIGQPHRGNTASRGQSSPRKRKSVEQSAALTPISSRPQSTCGTSPRESQSPLSVPTPPPRFGGCISPQSEQKPHAEVRTR